LPLTAISMSRASGEEANVLVRELDTHAVPLRSSGRVCRASLQNAEGSWRSRAAAGMPPD
jgi:hypothetical protein